MPIQSFRGCLALCNDAQVQSMGEIATTTLSTSDVYNFAKKPEMNYHVTLFTKEEIQKLGTNTIPTFDDIPLTVYALGVSYLRSKSVAFVPVLWPGGQRLRSSLGLPLKDFHITLSENDCHDVDKSILSIMPGSFPSEPSFDMLDALSNHHLIAGRLDLAHDIATNLCNQHQDSLRAFRRLADSAYSLQLYKLAMLSYGKVLHHLDETKSRALMLCTQRIIDCSNYTEWGTLFRSGEIDQIPSGLVNVLTRPWNKTVCTNIAEQYSSGDHVHELPQLSIEPREHLDLYGYTALPYETPRFTRWIVPFHLMVSSIPRCVDDIDAISSGALGIKHVLTLTKEQPLPEDWFVGQSEHTHLPIQDFTDPSPAQIDLFIELATSETSTPLLIHCMGGKGRTGTLIACYLVAFGFNLPNHNEWECPAMSAKEAIRALRTIRPGSVETDIQERAVELYESRLYKRQRVLPRVIEEPLPTQPSITGDTMIEKADLIILCGLPGSGKSRFRESLSKRDPNSWIVLSSDDIGRSACEDAIGKHPGMKRVLLDRCNAKASDRKAFMDLASLWTTHPIVVWFDYAANLCTQRAQKRSNHPSLTPGGRVMSAIAQHDRDFTPPTLTEGFKSIINISSFQASEELILRLSSDVKFFKFPRTQHMINLGAATRDDLLCSHDLQSQNFADTESILITEKVDGANLGLSLSPRGEIRVQNRSHYVNSSSHAQFKRLYEFIQSNADDLRRILGRDEAFPERYILFGEWLAATHSIAYTKLPDRFLAFDLYDRVNESWMSRGRLESLLRQTKIRMVPVVHHGSVMPSQETLINMVERESAFYCGKVEGVYIKVEDNERGIVTHRSKIVRNDFISGNEHWTRGIISFNQIEPSLE